MELSMLPEQATAHGLDPQSPGQIHLSCATRGWVHLEMTFVWLLWQH